MSRIFSFGYFLLTRANPLWNVFRNKPKHHIRKVKYLMIDKNHRTEYRRLLATTKKLPEKPVATQRRQKTFRKIPSLYSDDRKPPGNSLRYIATTENLPEIPFAT